MRLTDPEVLTSFLRKNGLKPDKGLGQHFICSDDVVDAIAASVSTCKGLLEIGPGPGLLTSILAPKAEKMISLEVDPRMKSLLAESAPDCEVRITDALQIDLKSVLEELPRPRAIVSNLPYYITGPLLGKIAEVKTSFDLSVLMMQKEVAVRITAPPKSGDRGSISVYLQALFQITKIVDAPAILFLPPPKVDSRVLSFVPKEESYEEALFDFIRIGFNHPRKTLLNNYQGYKGADKTIVASLLVDLGLTEKSRAQELSLAEWERLRAALHDSN